MNTQVGNAYLGILAAAIDHCGIQVMQLIPDSPAVAAQLQVGDVIVAVDGRAVSELCANNSTGGNGGSSTTSNAGCGNSGAGNSGSGQAGTAVATTVGGTGNNNTVGPNDVDVNNTALVAAFLREISSHRSGDTVTLVIQRAGQQLEVRVTLGAIPPGLLTPVGSPTATGGSGTQPTQPAASATPGASVTPNTTGTAPATIAATTAVTTVP